MKAETEVCVRCNGSGRISYALKTRHTDCDKCDGAGFVSESATEQPGAQEASPAERVTDQFADIYDEFVKLLSGLDDETFDRQLHQFHQLRYGSKQEWPKPSLDRLLAHGIAVSMSGSDAGFVYVLHVDGQNWTTGAKLTDMTFGMLKRNAELYSESLQRESRQVDTLTQAAKKLYIAEVNKSDIHCNRWPSWEELSEEGKKRWLDAASPNRYARN